MFKAYVFKSVKCLNERVKHLYILVQQNVCVCDRVKHMSLRARKTCVYKSVISVRVYERVKHVCIRVYRACVCMSASSGVL